MGNYPAHNCDPATEYCPPACCPGLLVKLRTDAKPVLLQIQRPTDQGKKILKTKNSIRKHKKRGNRKKVKQHKKRLKNLQNKHRFYIATPKK